MNKVQELPSDGPVSAVFRPVSVRWSWRGLAVARVSGSGGLLSSAAWAGISSGLANIQYHLLISNSNGQDILSGRRGAKGVWNARWSRVASS